MVDTILEWYRGIYEYLLAIPVICGTKSKKEKFAGADDTKTVEARHQATLCGACLSCAFSLPCPALFKLQWLSCT
jgi:prolyl-tRNA synthetase